MLKGTKIKHKKISKEISPTHGKGTNLQVQDMAKSRGKGTNLQVKDTAIKEPHKYQ